MTELLPPTPRRRWLLRLLQTSIGATLVALFYPVVRFLRPRPSTASGAEEMVAPYAPNQLRPSAQGVWPPPFDFGGKPCLLIRTPDGQIRAFNAICTHLACTVTYRAAEGDIFCNCHHGVFDLNGRNVSGPPPRPLQQYRVALRKKPGGQPGEEEIVVSRTA